MPQHCTIVRTYANCILTISRSPDGFGDWQAHVLDAKARAHLVAIDAGNAEKALEQATAFVDAMPEDCREWAARANVRI